MSSPIPIRPHCGKHPPLRHPGIAAMLALACGLLFFPTGCKDREKTGHTIKISTVLPLDHPTSQSLLFFKEQLEERSEGRIRVRLFAGGQLGSSSDTIELSRAGSIEMVHISVVEIAPFSPPLNALGMPFLFRSREHRLSAVDGPARAMIESLLHGIDLHLLAIFDAGDRNLMTKRGPVTGVGGLAGMKIRVMPSQLMVDSINAMGASAVAMNQGDVYTALQTGLLDGWENNLSTALNYRMHETGCIHFAATRHLAIPDFFVMSGRAYRKLPEDLRALVNAVAADTQRHQRELWHASESEAMEILREEGMVFNDVELDPFVERMRPLYEAGKRRYGGDFVKLLNLLAETETTK